MANVPIILEWKESGKYLMNLRDTVIRDIKPLLKVEGVAPFAIIREVLCYIDHLSHLYTGSPEVGKRFSVFLTEISSKVDCHYSVRAEEIYRMYRNGTVHEFEPKMLENNKGQRLRWLCFDGERVKSLEIEGSNCEVTHLVPCGKNDIYWLPVSTKCLIDDLVEFINIFIISGPEDERKTFWNRAARELSAPVSYDFKI